MLKRVALAIGLLVVSAPVQAHYVWLERDGAEARAYYGEWEEELREPTEKVVKHQDTLKVFQSSPETSLTLARKDDHFAVQVKDGDVRLIQDGLPPFGNKTTGQRTKIVFYAKAGRAETKAALPLELVPVSPNGDAFVLTFRGAPLPKTQLKLFGPPKWEKGLSTDEQGRVTLPLPWVGLYVVEVAHNEQSAGGAGENRYDQVRHISTISLRAERGTPWNPR